LVIGGPCAASCAAFSAKRVFYPVNEHFATFQGEGLHRGRRAYFIRLQGCDVACTFCDSASTWHRDFKPENIPLLSAAEVRQLVTLPARSLVVLTGGEPALHNLDPLSRSGRSAVA